MMEIILVTFFTFLTLLFSSQLPSTLKVLISGKHVVHHVLVPHQQITKNEKGKKVDGG